MLKVRVMPTLLYRDLTLVKGVRFDSWRRVGSLMQAIKVYNMREVDELVFLDISATQQGKPPDFDLVDDFADECFFPLTVGGGIRTVEHIGRLLEVGADKIAVNTAAVERPELVREGADIFGSQCIVVSIDAKKESDGKYAVYTHSGKNRTKRSPTEFAKQMEDEGAGEILLTSIDRDGTLAGYDLDLIRNVAAAVSIPVIASGGAGNYGDLVRALKEGKASAVASASMYHFTEQTPLGAKRHIASQGIPVRL